MADLFYLDLETNDKIPARARIVEIAILRASDGAAFVSLINPGVSVDGTPAAAVNGISDADLADAPTFEDVLGDIADLLFDASGAPLGAIVAYNGASFDRPIFDRYIAAATGAAWAIDWIDPLPIARRCLSGLAGYKMGQVGSHLGVTSAVGLHRAFADVELLSRIWPALQLRAAQAPVAPAAPAAGPDAGPAPGDALAVVERDAVAELNGKIVTLGAWIAKANSLQCNDDADESVVLRAISEFKKLAKTLEDTRRQRLDAVKGIVGKVEKAYRDLALKPIEAAILSLEALRRPLALERLRVEGERQRAAEQEAIRLAEAELARKNALARRDADLSLQAALDGRAADAQALAETSAAGAQAAISAAEGVYSATLAEYAKPAPPIRTAGVTVRDRPVYRIEVVAPTLVPSIYCSPDLAKIKEAIERNSGEIAIAGVRFEVDVASRYR